jgi:ABC-type phosphate transport system auxiliary subunit
MEFKQNPVDDLLERIKSGEEAIQDPNLTDDIVEEIEHHIESLRCDLDRFINTETGKQFAQQIADKISEKKDRFSVVHEEESTLVAEIERLD